MIKPDMNEYISDEVKTGRTNIDGVMTYLTALYREGAEEGREVCWGEASIDEGIYRNFITVEVWIEDKHKKRNTKGVSWVPYTNRRE